MKCESMVQHSQFFKKIIFKKLGSLVTVLVLLGGMAENLHAQMFSVGNPGPRFNTPQTELYVGVEPIDVMYKGGSDVPESQRGVFAFEGSIIRLGYNSPGVDFFLGTGGQITGIDDASYFDVGGSIDFGLNIYRSRPISLQLPVRIASRYTNITNDRAFAVPSLNRFRFGSLTFGAGARIVGRPVEKFRIEAGAVPSYGFAFASGGFFGGSLGSVKAFGRLYFDRLFGDVGIALGYKYDLRNYDVDEDAYDYRMKGHSLEIGITF